MSKLFHVVFTLLVLCPTADACHKGLFSRMKERRESRQVQYQDTTQSCTPAPQFVPAPTAPPVVPKTGYAPAPYYPSIIVNGNNNCVGGNCAGPTTIGRGGLLFRR